MHPFPSFRAFALAGALLAFATAATAATPITFDTYANGTLITNQYFSQGAVFSSVSGLPCTIMSDAAEATSGPNILVGASNFRDITLTVVDPATGLPSPGRRACLVSLNVISVGWSAVNVTSYDGAGAVLQNFPLTHPGGPVNGLGAVDHLDFNVGAIAKVVMHFTSINFGDGIGVDDVLVDFACATPASGSTWGRLKALDR